MGWMHDTLAYFQSAPKYRTRDYHKLTFSMVYAYNEDYLLPLSHDEVVHGKATIVQKMNGQKDCIYAIQRNGISDTVCGIFNFSKEKKRYQPPFKANAEYRILLHTDWERFGGQTREVIGTYQKQVRESSASIHICIYNIHFICPLSFNFCESISISSPYPVCFVL